MANDRLVEIIVQNGRVISLEELTKKKTSWKEVFWEALLSHPWQGQDSGQVIAEFFDKGWKLLERKPEFGQGNRESESNYRVLLHHPD